MSKRPNALAAARLRGQIMEMARRLRREAEKDEETWSRLLLLGAIDRYGSEATPGKLAKDEGLRSSNLAATLKDLELRGLINRSQATDDRRKVMVSLTETGATALQEVRERRDRWLLAAMNSELSADEFGTIVKAGELIASLARSTKEF